MALLLEQCGAQPLHQKRHSVKLRGLQHYVRYFEVERASDQQGKHGRKFELKNGQ